MRLYFPGKRREFQRGIQSSQSSVFIRIYPCSSVFQRFAPTESHDERADPHQRHPAGNAGRGHRAGRGAGAARRARLVPRHRGQRLSRPRVPGAAGHAVGLRGDRARPRRLPARGRHLDGPQRRRAGEAHREDPLRGPGAAGAGREGPDRSKGARLSTQVSIAGGSSSTCRRTPTSASRSASRDVAERENLREKVHSLIPRASRGASSSAPSPRPRPTPSSRPTSTTWSPCGSRSSWPPRPRPRRPCSTRTSPSPRACCATS